MRAVLAFFAATLLIALALPPAIAQRSWRRFLIALPLGLIGVALPLFVFSFSSFLVPEWKGGCQHEWVDCFYLGKMALTPLVLWATAALYATEIWGAANRTKWWIAMGFLFGAIVSSVCFFYGLFMIERNSAGMAAWLLVPLYVAAWHTARAVQLINAGSLTSSDCFKGFIGSLPFWTISVLWSQATYRSLPDVAPSCFIVTAAMRGHRKVVGPFSKVQRGGGTRLVNRQLLTLWELEALWFSHAPLSHAGFRRAYNHVGPRIAKHIQSPWAADLVYVAIIPVQILADCVLRLNSLAKRRELVGDEPSAFRTH